MNERMEFLCCHLCQGVRENVGAYEAIVVIARKTVSFEKQENAEGKGWGDWFVGKKIRREGKYVPSLLPIKVFFFRWQGEPVVAFRPVG